ncbi:MAG: gluconate:H+ symporter [Microscillaceae bacterium]|nr:gluconate:H+ symporter [Microscillaceae bacterium]
MPLFIVFLGVLGLLVLITVFKLDAFISFIIVSIFVGLGEGMTLEATMAAIEKGIGSTLGGLVMILGFGAMLGKLVADSGAAQRITDSLVKLFGLGRVQWSLMITGFIVGIPMFYNVGFVIMVPLAFTVAMSNRLPLLYISLPMLAALSVTHGYLPPHPSPTAIAKMFEADMGLTLIYGFVVAIPAILVAGPLFSSTVKKYKSQPLKEFYNEQTLADHEMPSLGISLLTALLPVLLIGMAVISAGYFGKAHPVRQVFDILGIPSLAMLLSVLLAVYLLGLRQGTPMKSVMAMISKAVSSVTLILLVIAGAGALKEVLVESGVSKYIGEVLGQSSLSPLFLAWLIAAAIRVCVGSATVAGLTAAGIIEPMVSAGGVSPELMTLSIGAGSLMLSHVNDSGFWMFKEYFNLSVQETLATWTVMETIVSVVGLLGILALSMII